MGSGSDFRFMLVQGVWTTLLLGLSRKTDEAWMIERWLNWLSLTIDMISLGRSYVWVNNVKEQKSIILIKYWKRVWHGDFLHFQKGLHRMSLKEIETLVAGSNSHWPFYSWYVMTYGLPRLSHPTVMLWQLLGFSSLVFSRSVCSGQQTSSVQDT